MWKTRFYYLKKNLLYYYSGPGHTLPKGVFFLLGCYVEKIKEDQRYGILITHDYEGYTHASLFCNSKEERDSWYPKLEEAAGAKHVDQKYDILEEIGTGKFSNVHKARNIETNVEYAIKIIDKDKLDDNEKEYLNTELAIIKLIEHPFIVNLIDVYEDLGKIYIVMEMIEGGELFDYIVKKKVLSEAEAALITH